MTDRAARRVYLVDGSGYIFRAYHALPPLTRPDGTPVGAVFGFCNMLIRLLQDTEADRIVIVFDAGRDSFRNEIYHAYKANRDEPPEDLVPQFAVIRDAVRAFNLPCIEREGFEADDIIATYARQAAEEGDDVVIVSSDKDLMQLVGGRVSMLDPIKLAPIGPEEVEARFGVPPEKVVDVQALAGDPTDNVPGVPGIGIKTAALLVNEYGDLETLLGRAGEIKQPKRRQNLIEHAEQARISKKLVELYPDIEDLETLSGMDLQPPKPEELLPFLESQGFRTLVSRIEAQLGESGRADDGTGSGLEVQDGSHELVTSMEALERWIAAAHEAGVVAFDTETTGLDAHACELVGVSLAVMPGRACYIPVGHVDDAPDGELALDGDAGVDEGAPAVRATDQLDRTQVMAALGPMLEDPAVLKVAQNAKFDVEVLRRCAGIDVTPIDDTMLLSYVLDGSRANHGMDDLAERLLQYRTIRYEEVAGRGKTQVTFDRVPIDRALDYAAEDADVTLRLWRILKPRLVQDHMVEVYETIERPLIPVLADMECTGVRVDREVLSGLSRDFTQRLAGLEAEIHELAGHSFNVGSPKQLGEVLFDEMGLEGGKRAKTGAWTTDANVLDDLAAQGHELPTRVLEWRQLSKLKSTYADALVNCINSHTGRVHTSFQMTVTSTGRLSSSDPNLQNIPIRTDEGRRIRRAFVAEPGYVLLSADYSQIELRLLAHVARIEALVEAFRNGHDIHAMTASQVFGMPVEGMDPMVRRQAKAINFGIIYGISPFGLARQLGVEQSAARSYIEAYFERYPGIRDYMERAKEFARNHGFVTTIFGRKCQTPGIREKNHARRSFQERAAINAPLQGSAADIIKHAMVRLPKRLRAEGLGARMLLQVHDELLFEVPKDETDATAAVVAEVMRGAVDLAVPLEVETGIGDNWADAH